MGRRGPKPQPAVIRQRKGNPGHRPIGADPAPAAGAGVAALAPPQWLKKRGLTVWHRIAPRLISLKLLTPADVDTFGRYCRNFARWLIAQEAIDKEGETYESESLHGKLKRIHPAFLIADRVERQLLAAEDRFGLNPAERQRLFAARAQNADPAARDLFEERRPNDPAAQPAEPAQPVEGPIGLLN
jgi:P27 family predicted phage terminase small subunit